MLQANQNRVPAQQKNARTSSSEESPLLGALSPTYVQILWSAIGLAALVIVWCIVDSCNHDTAEEFFLLQKFQFGMPHKEAPRLESPLLLAWMQFAFTGVVFLALWCAFTNNPNADLVGLKNSILDKRWSGMVVTHLFSTFWLQSMMMPTQVMSLGLFAATRAVEVPVTAFLRSLVIGEDNKHIQSGLTAAMMMGVAWILYFSYSQIAECLCIWSGMGVELSGVALYAIYVLVLVIPATNVVCQEAVLVKYETPPFLLLGVQNVLTCILCIPFMILAHYTGWENMSFAFHVMSGRTDMTMLVLWLCIQMCVLSAAGIGMIMATDSFWAVAFRCFRVVYWWGKELCLYYLMSKVSLSVGRPGASAWSFVMLCGTMVAFAAIHMDLKDAAKHGTNKSGLLEVLRGKEIV